MHQHGHILYTGLYTVIRKELSGNGGILAPIAESQEGACLPLWLWCGTGH